MGAFHLAKISGYPNIITFDMGGTSTDVALCEGKIDVTHEAEIDGMPIGIEANAVYAAEKRSQSGR